MLYLVRHGQTAHNAGRRLLGRIDVPLDELGSRQAEQLAGVEALAKADRVVCSPLARAQQTAAALGRSVEVDERWIEVDYGVYDGMPLAEVPTSAWKRWQADLHWVPEQGESFAQAGQRVRAACAELAAEAAEQDVVVVGHVTPIKISAAWALGVPEEAQWRMYLANASITTVGFRDGHPVLSGFNSTGHLAS